MHSDVFVTADEDDYTGHLLRHHGGCEEDVQRGGGGGDGCQVQTTQELICTHADIMYDVWVCVGVAAITHYYTKIII